LAQIFYVLLFKEQLFRTSHHAII